jgi:tRNA pseudouridine38-40 synthase
MTRSPDDQIQMSLPRTIKLTLAYDGTAYAGWQRQANALAVQQVVEEAFAHLTGGVPPTIAGAGRTDSGVQAVGQVASVNVTFEHSALSVQRALNMRLPADIRVIGAVEMPLGFHARFHAVGKSYRYRMVTTAVLSPFDRQYAWHVPWPLDTGAMARAAARLTGTHDFASFQAAGSTITGTVRTLDRLTIADAGGELRIDVEGDGFLRNMVRIIAGTLMEVGSGHRDAESIDAIIAARHRDAAGKTAPPHGLTLMSVRY